MQRGHLDADGVEPLDRLRDSLPLVVVQVGAVLEQRQRADRDREAVPDRVRELASAMDVGRELLARLGMAER